MKAKHSTCEFINKLNALIENTSTNDRCDHLESIREYIKQLPVLGQYNIKRDNTPCSCTDGNN
jgi:hypothetical protein